MKKWLLLLIITSFAISCKCKKTTIDNTQKITTKMLNDCPADAKCTQEIHKNSALSIEMDVATQKPYYSIVPQEGTTVYRYEMSENQDQQYLDSGYREEIIFELPSDFKTGVISSSEIQNTKALFGVFCYCKGKAGYYKINEGTITKTDKGILIEIPEIVEGQKVFSVQF